MINFQKFGSDKTGLGYDHSLSSCSTYSNALNRVIFFPFANNDNCEVAEPKIENVSEDKYDKGKSILGAPLRLLRRRLSRIIITLLTRSFNQRSHISAITMEHPGTLV